MVCSNAVWSVVDAMSTSAVYTRPTPPLTVVGVQQLCKVPGCIYVGLWADTSRQRRLTGQVAVNVNYTAANVQDWYNFNGSLYIISCEFNLNLNSSLTGDELQNGRRTHPRQPPLGKTY